MIIASGTQFHVYLPVVEPMDRFTALNSIAADQRLITLITQILR